MLKVRLGGKKSEIEEFANCLRSNMNIHVSQDIGGKWYLNRDSTTNYYVYMELEVVMPEINPTSRQEVVNVKTKKQITTKTGQIKG